MDFMENVISGTKDERQINSKRKGFIGSYLYLY
jgi:hypothetical protein